MHTANTVTKRKATGSHYTPAPLARFLAKKIIAAMPDDVWMSPEPIVVWDPACGDGALLNAFAEVLPIQHRERLVLCGIEADAEAIQLSRESLRSLSIRDLKLEEGDFLAGYSATTTQLSLFESPKQVLMSFPPASAIIANPPYVRTQVMGAERSQDLALRFNLTGRVDLYHAFMVAMIQQLAPGSTLGVITSNRFLFTRAGASTRRLLATALEPLEVLDLGDTKLFTAAVLPAIFVGRRPGGGATNPTGEKRRTNFLRIYEYQPDTLDAQIKAHDTRTIYDVLDRGQGGRFQVGHTFYAVTSGPLVIPDDPRTPWSMVSYAESAWLRKVEDSGAHQISDLAHVRVGIKTTADEVFIRDNWNALPDEMRPESALLRPLLSHTDARKWLAQSTPTHVRRVLYTHISVNGRRQPIDLLKYPKAAAYLDAHRERLERRTYVTRSGRLWFEIWVPQQPDSWKMPKIVFPDISAEPKFFYDSGGSIVDGDSYWISLRPGLDHDLLFLIQGVANSNLMTKFHDLAFNNKLYAGRRRYLTQYVGNYPIPDPSSEPSRKIIANVRELVRPESSDAERITLEQTNDLLVARAFGVEDLA